MKNFEFVRIALILFGLIGILIGGALLFAPITFESSAGIMLDDNISLLSEIRSYGGMVLSGGVIILLGAFIPSLTYTSLVIASLLYLSIGISRIFAIAVDGIPSGSLVSAMIAEIVIGGICVLMLLKRDKLSYAQS